MQHVILKFQVAAEKTTNNFRGLLFATPGRFSVKGAVPRKLQIQKENTY